jgi:hypothetical protein
MVILSLLFLNSNKRLQHKKVEVKKIKIILSILATMLTISIVIRIALVMSPTMFMLLNFAGLPRLNLMHVTHKPVHKNQQEEIKFIFDVAKCDKIFDELHKAGSINMSHTIPPLDELEQKAYCRHNSFSHATNDCNIFRRLVQSAINEGQLSLKEIQGDKNPFPVSTIDLQNSKVLIRPEQAEAAKGKNVVIGKKLTITTDEKILS